jgi:hypothetical protein
VLPSPIDCPSAPSSPRLDGSTPAARTWIRPRGTLPSPRPTCPGERSEERREPRLALGLARVLVDRGDDHATADGADRIRKSAGESSTSRGVISIGISVRRVGRGGPARRRRPRTPSGWRCRAPRGSPGAAPGRRSCRLRSARRAPRRR